MASPVTFHFIAKFLDVAKRPTGEALLLIGMIALAGHVTSFSAVVALLLPLPFGLLAVPGNVTTPVAVVACCRGKSIFVKKYTSCQLELRTKGEHLQSSV